MSTRSPPGLTVTTCPEANAGLWPGGESFEITAMTVCRSRTRRSQSGGDREPTGLLARAGHIDVPVYD